MSRYHNVGLNPNNKLFENMAMIYIYMNDNDKSKLYSGLN